MRQTDVVVIGAGPAGYVAAIRLAQLGKGVVLVEEDKVGGVCLNRGCIPVKALLHAAHTVRSAAEAATCGIVFGKPAVDFVGLHNWRTRIVQRLTKGLEFLFQANRVELLRGAARLLGGGRVSVQTRTGELTLLASEVVVATGSKPAGLSCLKVDGKRVLDSDAALGVVTAPERLAVVGAGAVGLEFATFFSRLGTKVVVVEMCDQVLPGIDPEIAALLRRLMEREGVEFRLGARVSGYDGDRLLYRNPDSSEGSDPADRVLVATGREPRTAGLGLEGAGATLDGQGFVETDSDYRSGEVFAIGDVRGGQLLAHKAMREGLTVAELIVGHRPERSQAVPLCVYTDPEVAAVGMSEQEAREQGYEVRVVQAPASAVGRSLTLLRPEGLCRMVVDAKSGRILGVTLLCAQADVLIAEACVAVELGLKAEELGRAVHPHPTMSELLFEAAETVMGRAVHIVNR